ncbi:UDP-N-acetylglucosamine 1-carboxyvinyltransferase [Actinospica robiniae]|uniref:UDP-N-acetylglucosamine 1-carboxyvinyltransferase n=1 Tax=Actinospica robiniae TaxID=304901 RepID=UPI0003F96405|nr:UDP-N-acetylglucosamine 1-carboxyvinyltransferase [Actinospica robiniae]
MTRAWKIEPTGPLRGDVTVRGSKNAVTKHMVAAILGHGASRIGNAPRVGDVEITASMLRSLGCSVERDADTLIVERGEQPASAVPQTFTGRNRIPVLLLGPLLNLTGEAFVPLVGGDRIGPRPLDFHISALAAMGAQISVDDTGIHATAKRLQGTKVKLPYPSVGATESIMLSAVLAEGRTVISNAAVEPEIMELALFLQRMGAGIQLQPDRRILIEGVEKLHGADTRLSGDRLEAFSYLVAGLLTGGQVRVHGCAQERLVTAIETLRKMGTRFDIGEEYISASAPDGLRSAAVHTDTHPGFATDWQQPLLVLMSQARGLSVLHETVFENRFVYVKALQQLGCEIELFPMCLGGNACRFHDTNHLHSAVVHGPSKLVGAQVHVPDVRTGFSSVIAASIADGPSVLMDVESLERGYDEPLKRLQSLGMAITVDEAFEETAD